MRTQIMTITVGMACTAALALTASPAGADTRARTDARRDAPASIDISRATYRHTGSRVSTTIRVPHLGKRGRASLAISRYGIFEAGYVAVVRKMPGQRAKARLFFFDHVQNRPRACTGLRGTWKRSTGTITVSVPRTCLPGHRTRRLYVAARTMRGDAFDDAPAVTRLRRG